MAALSSPPHTLTLQALPSSYRDPAGFMIRDGRTYRRVVTQRGLVGYRQYMDSGLHQSLIGSGMILDHSEEVLSAANDLAFILTPEQIDFISYPYEWCFDELRDAALLTLRIQEAALAHGMTLKDASPYNVQFRGAKPVFIDTLSFEKNTGGPWVAYEQFCRQFLSPLYLMMYGWDDVLRFLKADLNGLSLKRTSNLLPSKSYFNMGTLLHLHLHARSLQSRAGAQDPKQVGKDTKAALAASLRKAVENLSEPRTPSEWTAYYSETLYYSVMAREAKQEAVIDLTAAVKPKLIYDLGTNTGLFARLLTRDGTRCVAFERDIHCVNQLYLDQRERATSNILPLVMDLDNPSPGLGFGLEVTQSLFERPQADLVLSLALIHHLRFSANIPLRRQAEVFARLGRWLLIEFVPRKDPAVAPLIHGREGFDDYTLPGFLDGFGGLFFLRKQVALRDSERSLYLFERRN